MLKQILSPAEKTAVKKMLDEARNVVITCHTSPDGDAIGSSLALWEYLTRKGKKATVIVPNYFPDFLKWMNGADRILLFDRSRTMSKNLFFMADLVVALDYNEPRRLDEEDFGVVGVVGEASRVSTHARIDVFGCVLVHIAQFSDAFENAEQNLAGAAQLWT